MSATLQALDFVLRLQRRRVETFENEVVERAAAVAACRTCLTAAEVEERERRAVEEACADRIERLVDRVEGFRPSDLLTLRHVLEGLAQSTREATAERAKAATALDDAEQALQRTRADLERARQRIEFMQTRRQALVRALEAADEDRQDEESEEASVARLVARGRAEELDAEDRAGAAAGRR